MGRTKSDKRFVFFFHPHLWSPFPLNTICKPNLSVVNNSPHLETVFVRLHFFGFQHFQHFHSYILKFFFVEGVRVSAKQGAHFPEDTVPNYCPFIFPPPFIFRFDRLCSQYLIFFFYQYNNQADIRKYANRVYLDCIATDPSSTALYGITSGKLTSDPNNNSSFLKSYFSKQQTPPQPSQPFPIPQTIQQYHLVHHILLHSLIRVPIIWMADLQHCRLCSEQ